MRRATVLCDSSCSRWLFCLRLCTSACSTALSSFSCKTSAHNRTKKKLLLRWLWQEWEESGRCTGGFKQLVGTSHRLYITVSVCGLYIQSMVQLNTQSDEIKTTQCGVSKNKVASRNSAETISQSLVWKKRFFCCCCCCFRHLSGKHNQTFADFSLLHIIY